jgi:hypothetical protein
MKNTIIFNQLMGQVCWRAWRGGGSAVFLELGKKLPNKNGTEPQQGEYTISLSSSKWSVLEGEKIIFCDDSDLKLVDQLISKLQQLTLKEITFLNNEEVIYFNKNISIKISHPHSIDEWYVLTPSNEISVSGNGISVEDAE